MIANTW